MKILAERADGKLELLDPEKFSLEVKLQELLETHPSLVLTDTVDNPDRRIWTIGWEVSVEAGSIDLLLLDSAARIWVVETKLAANSEIKKQVVGQVLGYASCAAEWTADDLERIGGDYLARRVPDGPDNLIELLAEDLGDEEAARALLEEAAEHAQLGDITALIVVDEIPKELRRLVEWVNGHASFELLAMKVEVVPHEGSRLFIPTVVGTTAKTRPSGGPRSDRQWDEESFFDELERRQPTTVAVARRLFDWAQSLDRLEVQFGKGTQTGQVTAYYSFGDGDWVPVLTMSTSGQLAGTWVWRSLHRYQTWWSPYIEVMSELSGLKQLPDAARGFSLLRVEDADRLEMFQDAVIALMDRIDEAAATV